MAEEQTSVYLDDLACRLWEERDDTCPPPEDALMAFLEWTEEQGRPAWPHQEEALFALATGDHVILGTPTGSGKSLVACGMHFLALCEGKRSYYTAPIKALVSEKFFNLVELFGKENVGMITGDTHINTDAPIVCCTEEILANQALREGADCDVDCVVMDEFHFFAEPDRGWAWQVPLLALPNTQFMLMSATLGDVTEIAEGLEERTGRNVSCVLNAPRPVPLEYEYVTTSIEATVELALREENSPIYIVHFSQDEAYQTAQDLVSYGVSTKEQRQQLKEALKGTRFTTAFGKALQRLLSAGVGVHHAGMLPRYRLLVEKLAQQGLLPVICGTDTLGVGINVPIHTVLLTALVKFDGSHMRKLRAREFHQIAGRAGRAGFDTTGLVLAQAPDYEVENAKALAKAGNDPKKLKKIKKKSPRQGQVTWNKQFFDKVVAREPEPLHPRMRVTHSMVLAEIDQGGDALQRLNQLIDASHQSAAEKIELRARAAEIFQTLLTAGIVLKETDEDGQVFYTTTVELPEDFAMDQPLAPFLLAALDMLDMEDENYALDLISLAEATLENPHQILRAQENKAKTQAMTQMKAEGIEYEERLERLEEVTYPQPLAEELEEVFSQYCEQVPWAADYALRPKSVLRDMVETMSDFKGYIAMYKVARSEGLLLRYLSDAYRVLARTIPLDRRNEQLEDIICWLGLLVRSIDSSLLDEWEHAGEEADIAAPALADVVVADRHGLTVLVRNALFKRVSLAARGKVDELGALDEANGYGRLRWGKLLDAYYEEHEDICEDPDARSAAYFFVDEAREQSDHLWHAEQTFKDSDDARDFLISCDIDLDATQDEGEVIFANYQVGFFEDIER